MLRQLEVGKGVALEEKIFTGNHGFFTMKKQRVPINFPTNAVI
jgi:hypothetical protein